MLKRISCEDVRLGMFIRSFEGSWLSHPFWRKSFRLENPADVEKVRRSGVAGVLIDLAQGVDVAAPVESVAIVAGEEARFAPSVASRSQHTRRIGSPIREAEPTPLAERLGLQQPTSLAEEMKRASKIVDRSKTAVTRMFAEARLGRAVRTAEVAPLVNEIAASVARNPSALIGIARLKSKDEYTYMHSVAVCALMINFARHLELDEAVIRDVGMAGLLHDIGKMAVPDMLLNKPGRLTDEEFDVVRGHPARGHEMLLQTEGIPDIALDVCLHHHEKVDGTGYPHGLSADQISLFAKMGAICDVYDAITSARAYKEPWDPGEALSRMLEWSGHFDEVLLSKFLRSIAIYPLGMLVRLRSNRLGIVTGAHPKDPTRTQVRAFYSVMDREIIAPESLTVSHDKRGDQIVSREVPERWGIADWDVLSEALLGGKGLAELKACRRRDAA